MIPMKVWMKTCGRDKNNIVSCSSNFMVVGVLPDTLVVPGEGVEEGNNLLKIAVLFLYFN